MTIGALDFAALHQFVHGEAELGALAIAEPADTRGQSLKMDSLLRQFHPARENCVLGKHLERELIGARDVGGIATQRDPTKRSFPFAKERSDIFRNEAGNIECVSRTPAFFAWVRMLFP